VFLNAVGRVGNASDILSSRTHPTKQGISNKRCGDPLGMETAISVAVENLPPAPAWVTETASRATEQALGEECAAADRRAAVAEPVRRITELYIIAVLDGLRVGAPPRSPELAAGLSEIVCDAVRQKVPLYYFLRALRIAQTSVVGYSAVSGSVTDYRRQTVRSGPVSDLASAYTESFSARIAQVYVTEEDKRTGGLSVARERLVKDVIAECPVDPAAAEWVLGLNLAHHHLAVVLQALPGTKVPGEQFDRFAIELARALGSHRPLIVPSGPAGVWIWISWPQPPEDGFVTQVCRTLSPPPEIRASMGPVAAGVTGFRRSHLGAQAAARVASAGEWGSSWFYDYADVAVVSLLTSDPQQARWFVEETLGALGQPGRRPAELRETLRVYLAFGRSRVRTAERLHVARNTVAYRVDKAVALLGRQISRDELPVRLALEIARVLPNGA